MTQIIYTLLLLFAPVPLLIVWGRIKVLRQRAAEDDALQPKPFAPKPEPTPGFLLRRFPLPERTYLRQQAGAAKVGFCIVAWCTTVLMSKTLLPGGADNPYDWFADDPALLWNNYLQSAFLMIVFGCMFALITAMTAGFGITATGPGSMMNRTRPITHRLLFWGRVGPALLTLFSAYATGIAISLMLLYVLHGPVWSQLNDSQGFQLTVKQLHRIAWMQTVSLPRLLLSIFTTSSMVFSAFLLLQQLPLNRIRVPWPLVLLVGPAVFIVINQLVPNLLRRDLRFLFFYNPNSTAPPSWSAALVPIGITAALLTLSQLFNRRSEP